MSTIATAQVNPVVDTVAPDRPWLRAARAGAGYWAISHVMYLAIQFVSWRLNKATGRPTSAEILHSWVQFDSFAYVLVAEHGYPPVTDPTFMTDSLSVYTVWPPFYPIVIRGLSFVLPGLSFATLAVVVANAAGLAMLIVLYRLLDHEMGRERSGRALFYLIAFPTAFFFAMAYSESLFLLLAVSVLYLARRGHWWAAGVVGAMVSATRVVGLLIIVALAYEYLRQRDFKLRRIRPDLLAICLVPVGLGAYMYYCWKHFGDALIFSHAQVAFGREGFVAPWESVYWSLQFGDNRSVAFRNLLDLGMMFGVAALLVLALVGPWRLRRDQFYLWLFGALPFLSAVLQPVWPHAAPFNSMNRYALVVLPAFMVLTNLAKNRFVERLYLSVAFPLQAGLMLLHIRFDWAG